MRETGPDEIREWKDERDHVEEKKDHAGEREARRIRDATQED
jgi:hypothetical protein